MQDNQTEGNLTRTASDGDTDVSNTSSYGWLFSTITAFGLLLFLTLSFTCYHRRLVERRKRVEEYLSYFRIVRPDLDLSGTKITRARSTLTNAYNIGASYITNESEHDNEAYNAEAFSNRWNCEDTENDQKWMILDTDRLDTEEKIIRTNKGVDDKMDTSDSGKMRRNKLLTDRNSQAKVATDVDINTLLGLNATNLHEEQPPQKHDTNSHRAVRTAEEDMRQLGIEQTSSKPNDNEIVQLSCEIVAHKPPKMKGKHKTKLAVKEDIDRMENRKLRRKKKRHYLNSSNKKSAISLDGQEIVQFYSQPRRQSEPSLYFYTKDEIPVDPRENKAVYNPYYMEIGKPLANESGQSVNIKNSNGTEQPEFDLIRTGLPLQHGRPLPILDNVYHEHISTSTWM